MSCFIHVVYNYHKRQCVFINQVIAAEGEQKASRALKEAAAVIGEASGALQLRYLQTLTTIAAEKNSTIIFPLPLDLMTAFLEKKKTDWKYLLNYYSNAMTNMQQTRKPN
jgi:hypothetical protein